MYIMWVKELIKEKGKNRVLSSVDATDLTLWKVKMTMGPEQHNKLSCRLISHSPRQMRKLFT